MSDDIVTFTPAPALDVTIQADSLTAGVTHRVPPAHARLGGKGINVANVAAAQGYAVAATGPVGPSGARAGGLHPRLHTAFTDPGEELRTTWSVFSDADADAAMFNEPAKDFPAEVWRRVRDDVAAVLHASPGAVFTVSGSAPAELDLRSLCATATAGGAHLIADVQGDDLLAICELHPAFVKPNAVELAQATGARDLTAGARELIQRGARCVAVSHGAEGLLFLTEDDALQAKLPRPLSGNATGAGDAAVAAIASGLVDGLELRGIATRAAAWSAAAVLSPVAGELGGDLHEISHSVILSSRKD